LPPGLIERLHALELMGSFILLRSNLSLGGARLEQSNFMLSEYDSSEAFYGYSIADQIAQRKIADLREQKGTSPQRARGVFVSLQ